MSFPPISSAHQHVFTSPVSGSEARSELLTSGSSGDQMLEQVKIIPGDINVSTTGERSSSVRHFASCISVITPGLTPGLTWCHQPDILRLFTHRLLRTNVADFAYPFTSYKRYSFILYSPHQRIRQPIWVCDIIKSINQSLRSNQDNNS